MSAPPNRYVVESQVEGPDGPGTARWYVATLERAQEIVELGRRHGVVRTVRELGPEAE